MSSGGMAMDLPAIIFHIAATAGVAFVKHIIETYLNPRFYAPRFVDRPSSVETLLRQERVLEDPDNDAIDDKVIQKIALSPFAISQDPHTPTYNDHCHLKTESVAGLLTCTSLTIVTAALDQGDSTHARFIVNPSDSASSSDTTSMSSRASDETSVDVPMRSGGNPPGGGPSGEAGTSVENKDTADSRTRFTFEDSSPPPPPPPSFPPAVQDAYDDVNKRNIDWISFFLFLPLIALGLKRCLTSFRTSSNSTASASTDKPDDVLSRVLGEMGIMDYGVTSAASYPNPIPQRASACDSAPHVGAGIQSHMNPLQFSGCNLGTVPSASVQKSVLNGWIKLVSTTRFMVSSFVLPLLPLLLFYIAGYYLDHDDHHVDEGHEQAPENSDSDVSEISSDLYATIGEDDEQELTDMLLGDILGEEVWLLREKSEESNIAFDARIGDMSSEPRFMEATVSTPWKNVTTTSASEQSTPSRTLNPMASVFIPQGGVTEGAQPQVRNVNSFFTPPPPMRCAVPIVSPSSPHRCKQAKRESLDNEGGGQHRG